VKLTSRGELAMKAMIELARSERAAEPGLPASEIARRCRASLKFLEQVLNQLRAGGYVVASRGRLGGYRLARNADEVVIGEISRLVDGPLAPAPCASVLHHRQCDWCEDENTCDLKTVWVQVRDATAAVMDGISLADLARQAESRTMRDRYVI
jgi:Rrf2 family protein